MESELSVSAPATVDAPSAMRARARAFLKSIGATPQSIADIVLAVSEAVTNATEHAYPDGTGDVEMRIRYDGRNAVRIEIADRGSFRDRQPAPGRGRGLVIIRSVASSVTFAFEGGTRIVMVFDAVKGG